MFAIIEFIFALYIFSRTFEKRDCKFRCHKLMYFESNLEYCDQQQNVSHLSNSRWRTWRRARPSVTLTTPSLCGTRYVSCATTRTWPWIPTFRPPDRGSTCSAVRACWAWSRPPAHEYSTRTTPCSCLWPRSATRSAPSAAARHSTSGQLYPR